MPTPNGQLYAMYIICKDGKILTMYSRDWKRSRDKKTRKRDKLEALKNCFAYLYKREHRVKIFEIYDHSPGQPNDGTLVFKWNQGNVIQDQITHLVQR